MIRFGVIGVVVIFFIVFVCECFVGWVFCKFLDGIFIICVLIIGCFFFDIVCCVGEVFFGFRVVGLVLIEGWSWVFLEIDFDFLLLVFFLDFFCFLVWIGECFGEGLNFGEKLLNESVLVCFFKDVVVCFGLLLILLVFRNVLLSCGDFFFKGVVWLILFIL